MLIDPISEIKKYDPLTGSGLRYFWARVISNEDPRMLGRVKCQIHDLLPFTTKEKLPWFYPLYPVGLGQGPKTSYFYVPEEDSHIIIVFPHDSIYFGYYIGHVLDRQTRMIDFMSNYPERYGFQDSLENKWIYDKHLKTEERRYADKSFGIWDSENSTYFFRDTFGTRMFVDRKNQLAKINFGGLRIRLEDGQIKIEFKEILAYCFNQIRLSIKNGFWISSKLFRYIGKLWSVNASEMSETREVQYEQSQKHEATGVKNTDEGVVESNSSTKKE